jgi:cytochrome c oxidase subunit 2
VQRYAIPGRTIETWVRVNEPGDYYGECNQICGTNHSFMPISVHALPSAEFQSWVAQAKVKFAADQAEPANPAPDPNKVAVVEAPPVTVQH